MPRQMGRGPQGRMRGGPSMGGKGPRGGMRGGPRRGMRGRPNMGGKGQNANQQQARPRPQAPTAQARMNARGPSFGGPKPFNKIARSLGVQRGTPQTAGPAPQYGNKAGTKSLGTGVTRKAAPSMGGGGY